MFLLFPYFVMCFYGLNLISSCLSPPAAYEARLMNSAFYLHFIFRAVAVCSYSRESVETRLSLMCNENSSSFYYHWHLFYFVWYVMVTMVINVKHWTMILPSFYSGTLWVCTLQDITIDLLMNLLYVSIWLKDMAW